MNAEPSQTARRSARAVLVVCCLFAIASVLVSMALAAFWMGMVGYSLAKYEEASR